jgi:hypothetical protein
MKRSEHNNTTEQVLIWPLSCCRLFLHALLVNKQVVAIVKPKIDALWKLVAFNQFALITSHHGLFCIGVQGVRGASPCLENAK